MEKVWRYTLSKLGIKGKNKHPVLLTEAANNPRKHKRDAAKIFFETFDTPQFYVQIQDILSLYASGRTTGAVLNCGDGVTSAVPIYEGYAIRHAVQRNDVAGRDVTEYLQMLIRKGGYNFHTSTDLEVVKKIKEKFCYFAYDFAREEEEYDEFSPVEYSLPDDKVIKIGPEKFRGPEILFDPVLIGKECGGVHEILIDAINYSPLDIRKTLCTNVTLAGGSTNFLNIGERLMQDLQTEFPQTKIRMFAPRSRLTSAWVGGAIFASLSSFKQLWTTKQDWEEGGERVIYEKCR